MSNLLNEADNQQEAVKRIEALLFAAPGLTSVEQLPKLPN
jgi:uncharacterized protein YoaH (UPF0181 family)